MCLCFLLGIISGFHPPAILLLIPLLVLYLFIQKTHFKISIRVPATLGILVVLIGFFYSFVMDAKRGNIEDFFRTENTQILGIVYKKEYKNEKYRMYVKNIENKAFGRSSFNAICFMEDEPPKLGCLVRVKGGVNEIQTPANEGEFDYKEYLISQRIVLSVKVKSLEILKEPKISVKDILYNYKQSVCKFYAVFLPGEESGLLASIVLGEKTELIDGAAELFRKAGLSHILAISGLHMSVLGAGVYGLLRKRGLSFLTCGIISGMVVLFYGAFAGNPVSLIRALVMFIVMIVANITGRAKDMLNSLALAAFILLVSNPFYVYHSGFILSFSAILGIILSASPLCDYYEKSCRLKWKKRMRDKGEQFKLSWGQSLIKSLISGAMISIFSCPVISFFFYEIPTYSILLNLVLLPFLGVLLIAGLFSGLFFFSPSLVICHYILYFYEAAADFVCHLPGSSLVIGKPSLIVIFIYYFILLFCVYLIVNRKSFLARYCLCIIPLNVLLFSMLIFTQPKGFRIDMLSVGQGDGIYIKSAENLNFFIDGGSTSKKEIGKYTILPFLKSQGVSKIDYWILTHLDEDHISGFIEIIEKDYRVENLILAKSIEKDEAYSRLIKLCKEHNVALNYVKRGDRFGSNEIRFDVLYPDFPSKTKGANENCLCLGLNYKDFEGIFTGDLGVEQEDEMLSDTYFKNYLKGKDIELLKVGHHGSKNSSGEKFIDAISPECGIISAGENNRYGHPHNETLQRFKEKSVPVITTIEAGRIRIEYKGGMKIDKYYDIMHSP